MPSAPTRSSTPLSVRSDLAELTGQLVAIDSTNPDLVPGGAGEAEVAAFVAGWLREAGLEVDLHEAAPGRPNVVAVARGTGGGASLLLNAHMDTVGVAGMESPFTPVAEGRPPARARRRRHEGAARRDHAGRRCGGAGRPARRRHRQPRSPTRRSAASARKTSSAGRRRLRRSWRSPPRKWSRSRTRGSSRSRS